MKRQNSRQAATTEDKNKRNKRRRGVKNWWKDVEVVETKNEG